MIKYVKAGMSFSLPKPSKGGANELNIISILVKYGSIFNSNSPNYLQQKNAPNSHPILMLS
ncbi:hypothetical protein [Microcoleus sp. S13_C5]|uniref:hypothetical protein n=1 Tax=Microcoleus sp. S13_C5 TaxID=3055411 RepID=UPI002FD05A14